MLGTNLSPKIAQKAAGYLKFAGRDLLCQTLPQVRSIKPFNFGGLKLAEPLNHDIFVLNPIAPKKIKTLAEIQKGVMGRIRTPDELSTKDIMRVIEHQLSAIKAEDIEKVLAKFPKEDQTLALKAMKKLTQFGNMESLNPLVETTANLSIINIDYRRLPMFLNDGKPSLSNNLSYMSSKGTFEHICEIDYSDVIGSYILDKSALENLETNQGLRNQLKEIDTRLIYPEGWINGVNPYNQTDDLFEKVQKVLKDTNKIKRTGFPEDKALSIAINKPILKRLEKIGMLDNLFIIENEATKNMPVSVESIVSQLKPVSISEEILAKNLSYLEPEQKQAALEVLARGMTIVTPKNLGEDLKNIHSQVLRRNNNTLDGVYYYIPAPDKSYDYIAMQYQLTNNIPQSKIVRNKQGSSDLSRVKFPDDCKKVVILDDISVSGVSLQKVMYTLRARFKDLNLTFAPIYMHNAAESELIHCANALQCTDKIDILSAKKCETITKTEYFNSLDNNSRKMIEKISAFGGYRANQHTNIVFPWMGPDNNNAFFSNVIAPFFTLNQKGVKPYGDWFKPNPNVMFQKGKIIELPLK